MATKKSKSKQARSARRQERRFVPQASTSVVVVRAVGALAALALGAGVWAYVYGKSFEEESVHAIPSYLIAGGAVLLGIAIWIGTSSESPVRVGAPGIAQEKGELRRMPWWAVSSIGFDASAVALVVTGKDEALAEWTLRVPVKTHPEAAGWIVREARERIPKRVDIEADVLAKLPAAHPHGGQLLELEPLQVVGKRCAATDRVISYEPDARVCPRCERVYYRTAVPKKCKCGASLADLRGASVDADDDDAPASSENAEA